ncbi:hypothetical protein JHK82_048814 [Glycine max]|uniref:Outer envelope pore protein 24A, chloroplastic n=1 Tax=Glycine soja TaxID=3848 RepID=A0A445GBS0_GLYSO|nr:outer envelope pore protein 24A, chloroplastic-like [Glycine max]XP_028208515.1 outer envelope pore protein 24A, chloroplastic-like [Glycine soja]KAG4931703.1 hypothetical protein JHK86_048664 [Glycine max]KAG4944665.1 hypothetical protein JHK85_049311 [Glycine max]KAG5098960.1 hypothetical protein JHK82_048814 [Glycine max]KAG5103728.1 hypothetical protein JHK84_048697 [Glycine max]RZB58576.1 Outer envelope pore protein 24A, chloroplastic [Glycine soja]|eukprot:XP_006601702.1 outer envelope pore protein 24A, chloroplastic-like [Glycine max]
MNTVVIGEKPLKFSYEHSRGNNTTLLEGTFELDPANKVSVNYAFDSKICKLKYTYVHEELTTFEPTYDMAKNTWDFATIAASVKLVEKLKTPTLTAETTWNFKM